MSRHSSSSMSDKPAATVSSHKRSRRERESTQHNNNNNTVTSKSSHDSSSNSNDAFRRCKCKIPIHLHPSRIGRIAHGIEEQLNLYLLQYNDTLKGIVLSYSGVKLPSSQMGSILFERPHINFTVECTFLVLNIAPQQQLHGTVIGCAEDHISLLLSNHFPVSITHYELQGLSHHQQANDNASQQQHKQKLRFVYDAVREQYVDMQYNSSSAQPIFKSSGTGKAADKKLAKAIEKEARRQAWLASQAATGGDGAAAPTASNEVASVDPSDAVAAEQAQADGEAHNIRIGSVCRFTVLQHHNVDGVVSIDASLSRQTTDGVIVGLMDEMYLVQQQQAEQREYEMQHAVFPKTETVDEDATMRQSNESIHGTTAEDATTLQNTDHVTIKSDPNHVSKKDLKLAKQQAKASKSSSKQQRTEAPSVDLQSHNNNNQVVLPPSDIESSQSNRVDVEPQSADRHHESSSSRDKKRIRRESDAVHSEKKSKKHRRS